MEHESCNIGLNIFRKTQWYNVAESRLNWFFHSEHYYLNCVVLFNILLTDRSSDYQPKEITDVFHNVLIRKCYG